MKEEVSSAITYALSKGFQIHPDAFKILEKIDVKELQNIIKQVVREKAKQNMFLINQSDLKMFVESEIDDSIENNHVILFDPSKKVTSAEGIDAIGIFEHNASVALPMFVPGFGLAWGAFAAWSTGVAFGALVTTTPALAKIPPLALLYLSPFGVMELVAYSLGMSRSFLLINAIIRRKPLKNELRQTGIEIGIALALLLAGGFIEYSMIQEFGSSLVKPKS